MFCRHLFLKPAMLFWENKAQLEAPAWAPAVNLSAETKYLIRPTPWQHQEAGERALVQYSFQGSLESLDGKSGKSKAGQKWTKIYFKPGKQDTTWEKPQA